MANVQSRLARLGLKDPWLRYKFFKNFYFDLSLLRFILNLKRNEVWRFDPQFGTLAPRTTLIKAGTTGMKYGLILAIGTVILQEVYSRVFGTSKPHGHGHGHGHEHH